MSIIERIDAKIIAVPYQWMVDKSQRGRVWWIQQTLLMTVFMAIIDGGIRDRWFITGMTLIMSFLFLFASRSDSLIDVISNELRFFRWAILLLEMINMPLGFVLLFMGEPTFFRLLVDVGTISFYYFAACKPPAPPKRKEEHLPVFNHSP